MRDNDDDKRHRRVKCCSLEEEERNERERAFNPRSRRVRLRGSSRNEPQSHRWEEFSSSECCCLSCVCLLALGQYVTPFCSQLALIDDIRWTGMLVSTLPRHC